MNVYALVPKSECWQSVQVQLFHVRVHARILVPKKKNKKITIQQKGKKKKKKPKNPKTKNTRMAGQIGPAVSRLTKTGQKRDNEAAICRRLHPKSRLLTKKAKMSRIRIDKRF